MDQRMLLCLRHARRVANLNLANAAALSSAPPPPPPPPLLLLQLLFIRTLTYITYAETWPGQRRRRTIAAFFLRKEEEGQQRRACMALFLFLVLGFFSFAPGESFWPGPFLFIKEELTGSGGGGAAHVFQFANV